MDNNSQNKSFYDKSILKKEAISEMCSELTSTEILDKDVEKYLVEMADNFIETVLNTACLNAKHKNKDKIEIDDIQTAVYEDYGIIENSLENEGVNKVRKENVNVNQSTDYKTRLELTKEEAKNTVVNA